MTLQTTPIQKRYILHVQNDLVAVVPEKSKLKTFSVAEWASVLEAFTEIYSGGDHKIEAAALLNNIGMLKKFEWRSKIANRYQSYFIRVKLTLLGKKVVRAMFHGFPPAIIEYQGQYMDTASVEVTDFLEAASFGENEPTNYEEFMAWRNSLDSFALGCPTIKAMSKWTMLENVPYEGNPEEI